MGNLTRRTTLTSIMGQLLLVTIKERNKDNNNKDDRIISIVKCRAYDTILVHSPHSLFSPFWSYIHTFSTNLLDHFIHILWILHSDQNCYPVGILTMAHGKPIFQLKAGFDPTDFVTVGVTQTYADGRTVSAMCLLLMAQALRLYSIFYESEF